MMRVNLPAALADRCFQPEAAPPAPAQLNATFTADSGNSCPKQR
jgi:hypothetical protein